MNAVGRHSSRSSSAAAHHRQYSVDNLFHAPSSKWLQSASDSTLSHDFVAYGARASRNAARSGRERSPPEANCSRSPSELSNGLLDLHSFDTELLPECHALLDQHRQEDPERETISTWDDALGKSTREFQHRPYNLFTCNCHSFVANNLNRLRFSSRPWNVVSIAALIFLRAKWVSRASVVRSFLPFLVVIILGLAFGGSKFLMFLAFFTFFLVAWFLIGTYCVKDLILL